MVKLENSFALLYHEVCSAEHLHRSGRQIDPRKWFIDPSTFRQQLGLIRSQQRTILHIDAALVGALAKQDCVFLTFDDGGISNYEQAYPTLEEFGVKAHFFVTTDSVGKQRFMDPRMIRILAAAGHHIGSHGKSHAFLPTLDSWKLYSELEDSKMCIEDIIAAPCRSLSIPSAVYTSRVVDTAFSLGYDHIFTSEPSFVKRLQIKGNVLGRWNVENNLQELRHLLGEQATYIAWKKLRYFLIRTILTKIDPYLPIYRLLSRAANRKYS